MKKLFVKTVLFIFMLITAGTIRAQQKVNLVLSYNPSKPLSSSFKNYVSNTSYRGIQAAVLYAINTDFRIGLQVSYNDFYQKYGRQVYKSGDGSDISAVLSNTVQYTPVLVKGEYSFVKGARIQPYIGLGAGIGLVNYQQYFGEFLYKQFYTKGAFSGDVGLLIPFKRASSYGLRASTSYNISPVNEEGINNISTWSGQVGVVIPLK